MDPIEMMAAVARVLERGGIAGTFAGGTVLAIHVDEIARAELRHTVDVDVIVRAADYESYWQQCVRLMQLGMEPGQEDGDPLCRFRGLGLVVDLMPTPFTGVGTDNPWFDIAVQTAAEVRLPSGESVRVITAAVHLATKVCAFQGRGGGDYLYAKDFEDIVALLDGRETIGADVQVAPRPVQVFLAEWCHEILQLPWLEGAVAGHVSRASGPGREHAVVDRVRQNALLASYST